MNPDTINYNRYYAVLYFKFNIKKKNTFYSLNNILLKYKIKISI